MILTMRDALTQLAIITGNDNTLIQDNAGEPATIYNVRDSIDPSDHYYQHVVVNEDGIFRVNNDGFVDPIPLYKVVQL